MKSRWGPKVRNKGLVWDRCTHCSDWRGPGDRGRQEGQSHGLLAGEDIPADAIWP